MSIGTTVKNMIWLRKASKDEPNFMPWMEANNHRTNFDPEVFSYPSTEIYAAHNNGTTYAYMPIQMVVQLDSVGVNPEASIQDVTASMIELIKGAAFVAQKSGIRELLFLVSDPNVQAGAEMLGFKELDAKVMRLKVGA